MFGYDPVKEPEKVHMISGIVTEHARMYDAMSGQDNLIFYAEVFGISGEEGKRRARELLEQMELTEAAERKLSAYSTGMRQRLSLARALLHHPRVLFLDEPTSGLDPESAQNVNRMIRSLAEKEGIAVFLCTHQLRYAQEICTRYGLIEEGRLLAEGTLEELRGKAFTESRVRIRTGQETMRLSIRSEKDIPGIVKQMVESGKDVYAVEEEVPTLEEIYFALTEGGKKQDE